MFLIITLLVLAVPFFLTKWYLTNTARSKTMDGYLSGGRTVAWLAIIITALMTDLWPFMLAIFVLGYFLSKDRSPKQVVDRLIDLQLMKVWYTVHPAA